MLMSYDYAYLPASTSSLLASSSLAFSALFGYLIVKTPLNASVINSIVIITGVMAIIALDSSSDRYSYISNSQYFAGSFWDIMGSASYIIACNKFDRNIADYQQSKNPQQISQG
ncbi:hypothetical protein ARALYDRAFT_900939 [Arabidopsis lyrata subsp. lyrata]|uniref:Uncharacterized protein n=1 Tax=Arabidopsis lyrata subsp. lyrata TaxID=81972 RepID=D7LHH9_ARALL|nr:hypothetical protein ARALYDRAFT_900939 [Arabidopsis lyrata subsp. lyrata]